MTNGPKHKYLRALVANPLSLENLKTYVPLIEKAVLAVLDSWKEDAVLPAHQEMRRVRATIGTCIHRAWFESGSSKLADGFAKRCESDARYISA